MSRLRLARSGPWIAVAGLVCLLWIDLASILFAPWWGVALMVLLWLVCAVLVLGWSRIHPARTAWVPVVGLVLWGGVVALGFGVWGW